MPDSIYLPLILQLLGVVVIIAEIILPSGGILSIVATCLFGYSLYLVFSDVSLSAGMAFIVADMIMIPVLVYIGIRFLAKSPVTLRRKLSKDAGVISQSIDENRFIGLQGRAITDLRPSGVALINDQRVDVVTRGEYLEKGTDVIVTAVSGNQIVIKKKEN